MCASLFNHLYETRLLFVKTLNDEFVATVGTDPIAELSPITINQLFHECLSKKLSFREFGRQYAYEYAKSGYIEMNN